MSPQTGINPKWEGIWKRFRSSRETSQQRQVTIVEELEYYALRGQSMDIRKSSSSGQSPPLEPWEQVAMHSTLASFANASATAFEAKGIDGGVFDVALAHAAFAACYTSEFMYLLLHQRFGARFGGRTLQSMQPYCIYFTALGLITGAGTQAEVLARLQLTAARKTYYLALSETPAAALILALFADYLGEQAPANPGRDPSASTLLAIWRTADPAAILPACLAVCDTRTWTEPLYQWGRTPIEILLVFKLRERLGLSNPRVDHPMLASALGVLPTEEPFAAPGVINRVRERLATQGYDESAIFSEIYDGPRKSELLAAFPPLKFPDQLRDEAVHAPPTKRRRLGIARDWLDHWDSSRLLFEAGRAQKDATSRKALADYASGAHEPGGERWLAAELSIYAHARILELEIKCVDGAPWDTRNAMDAFDAALLEQELALEMHRRDGINQHCKMLTYKMVPFTALGVVLGRHDAAFALARDLFHARRIGYYRGGGCPYPAFNFILRLLCDYLGEGPMFVETDIAPANVFNQLFDLWRADDPAKLAPLCETVCDFHTRRGAGGGSPEDDMEFSNGKWLRFPIELLLLFKLRAMLGLHNPALSHPLLDSSLGKLPVVADAATDPLLEQLRARMASEGLAGR
jgi:hypothetical protein